MKISSTKLSFLSLFLLVSITTNFSYAQLEDNTLGEDIPTQELIGVSESETYYLDHDHFFNTPERELFGRETKKVYVISVDVLQRYNSSIQINRVTNQLANFYFEPEDYAFLSDLAVLDREEYEWLRQFYAATLFREVDAVKVASHNTWWVWDSQDKTFPPFFVKDSFYSDLLISEFLTGESRMRRASNKEILSIVPELSSEIQVRSTYKGSFSTSNVFRPSFISLEESDSKRITPWFGFIGDHSIIDSLADKKGKTRLNYILDHVVPVFAKDIALFNYGYGVFHASHGQNTTVLFDQETGEIEDLIFRDLRDVTFDASFYLPTFSRNVRHYGLNKGRKDSIEGFKKRVSMDEPGVHFAIYTAQSLMALSDDFESRRAIFLRFFDYYIEQLKLEVGLGFELPDRISELLDKGTRLSQYELGLHFEEKVDGVVPLKGLLAFSAEMIRTLYTSVVQHRVGALDLLDFPGQLGRKIFKDESKTSRFNILNPRASKGPFQYKTDGDNLYLFNLAGEVYGVLFNTRGWFGYSKANFDFRGRQRTTWEEQISLLRTNQCSNHFLNQF